MDYITLLIHAGIEIPEYFLIWKANDILDPLYPDDQEEISKDYYIAPFQESRLLDQIPTIKKGETYFLMYKVKGDPSNLGKKDHKFVSCRFAKRGPEEYLPGPNIHQGWVKTDDGLFKDFKQDDYDIQGMRIRDDTLYLERKEEYPSQLLQVITVPKDIRKPSRERWLKGVAYTLTSDTDNIWQYILPAKEAVQTDEYIRFDTQVPMEVS